MRAFRVFLIEILELIEISIKNLHGNHTVSTLMC